MNNYMLHGNLEKKRSHRHIQSILEYSPHPLLHMILYMYVCFYYVLCLLPIVILIQKTRQTDAFHGHVFVKHPMNPKRKFSSVCVKIRIEIHLSGSTPQIKTTKQTEKKTKTNENKQLGSTSCNMFHEIYNYKL